MQNDSPENGARTIWLNQPTEKPTMISKLIEQRSRTLRAKTRRGLIGTVAGPLAAGIFYAYSMRAFPTLRRCCNRRSHSPSPGAWPDRTS